MQLNPGKTIQINDSLVVTVLQKGIEIEATKTKTKLTIERKTPFTITAIPTQIKKITAKSKIERPGQIERLQQKVLELKSENRKLNRLLDHMNRNFAENQT
jgi:hypothetical protein